MTGLRHATSFRRASFGIAACIFTIAVGFCRSGCAFAQVESASGADAAPPNSPPAGFRTSRFEIGDEYLDLQGGGTVHMIVPRVDVLANPDLSFRIETPMVFTRAGTPNNDTESGLGDILFRGSYRVARGAGYAIVAGGELILNTATSDDLGTGKNVIAPLIFASINVPRFHSVVFPFLQYYFTLGGDDARQDVNYTSIKSAFLTRWPHLVYTIVEPQLIVDHERADKIGMTLDGEIGHFLNRDTAIWVRTGVGLVGEGLPQVYDWKLEVGVRFFLK
jgi:hypothetical protein